MSQVIFDCLDRRRFIRLPKTDPPLRFERGQVLREGNGRVIYQGLTLEEFLRLPEARPALEYIDGMVVQKVSPKTTHSVIEIELGALLLAYAKRRRLGRTYPNLRCTFGGRSLVPDLVFFARGRIPKDKSGKRVDDVYLAPDLAIEILSPGQTVRALTARALWCLEHGVRLFWLIQPRRSRVLVFQPGIAPQILESGDRLSGSTVLSGFDLSLDEMFGWLLED
jgi:Uma2 family endonuclease